MALPGIPSLGCLEEKPILSRPVSANPKNVVTRVLVCGEEEVYILSQMRVGEVLTGAIVLYLSIFYLIFQPVAKVVSLVCERKGCCGHTVVLDCFSVKCLGIVL